MISWLLAYDDVQRKVLACYQQDRGESDWGFLTRADRLQKIWFRLRPSATVVLRTAPSLEALVMRNPDIFRTPADVALVRRESPLGGHHDSRRHGPARILR